MKILKDDTYYKLLSDRDNYKAISETNSHFYNKRTDECIKLQKQIEQLKKSAATEFIKKILIVGKKNGGKTHYIYNTILPKLNNYFIICNEGEYKGVDKKNKLCLSYCQDTLVAKELKENADKTIIIDTAFVGFNMIDSILVQKTNIILCIQMSIGSYNRMDFFNYILNFGAANITGEIFTYANGGQVRIDTNKLIDMSDYRQKCFEVNNCPFKSLFNLESK